MFSKISTILKVCISIPLFCVGFLLCYLGELQFEKYSRGRGKSEGGRGK